MSSSKTKPKDKVKSGNNQEIESQVEKSVELEWRCESCRKPAKNHITKDAIECDLCGNWVVGECTGIEEKELDELKGKFWSCLDCKDRFKLLDRIRGQDLEDRVQTKLKYENANKKIEELESRLKIKELQLQNKNEEMVKLTTENHMIKDSFNEFKEEMKIKRREFEKEKDEWKQKIMKEERIIDRLKIEKAETENQIKKVVANFGKKDKEYQGLKLKSNLDKQGASIPEERMRLELEIVKWRSKYEELARHHQEMKDFNKDLLCSFNTLTSKENEGSRMTLNVEGEIGKANEDSLGNSGQEVKDWSNLVVSLEKKEEDEERSKIVAILSDSLMTGIIKSQKFRNI